MSNLFKMIFRRYFLVGVIVLLPFYVTLKVFLFVIRFFDQILKIQDGYFLYVIPQRYHPEVILDVKLPGLGFVISVCMILFIGILSRNYFGKKLIRLGDSIVDRIPFAGTIYKVVKETLKTFASRSEKQQFSNVVLIQYPRKNIYTVAFVTSTTQTTIAKHTGKKLLNIFVPTTPNPTSGYLIMVPEEETIDLDLSVEEAFKLIVSGGMVHSENELEEE